MALAEHSFRIFKVPDRELVDNLVAIADSFGGKDNVEVEIYPAREHNHPLKLPASDIKTDAVIQKVLPTDYGIIHRFHMTFPAPEHTSVTVLREDWSDLVTLKFKNDVDVSTVARLSIAARSHFTAYERTEATDKLLGDELAEFYRKREQTLLRLEQLSEQLIRQNEEYRSSVDKEYSELKTRLIGELEAEKAALHKDHKEKKEGLEARERALAEQKKELDDRSSTHARRQLRQDIKKELAERGKQFTLTAKTARKRLPIHALFLAAILTTGAFFAVFLNYQIWKEGTIHWYELLRLSLSAAAVAAVVVFYIRWNDQWFREHAEEEFRFKRLELDIDRASWVVEMALEWKDEKGTDIPTELLLPLTTNLFADQGKIKPVRHPSEDLASALVDASTGLKVDIPGGSALSLDRRGVQRFAKAVEERREEAT